MYHLGWYDETMLRTNLYITADQDQEIGRLANISKMPKAAVLRQIIDVGLKSSALSASKSAQSLLKLAQKAENLPGSGPKDLSKNLDKYAWE